MVKTLKIFSGTKRLMTLKLGMHHRVHEYYQVFSNDDPVDFDIFLRQGQIWSLMLLYGKKGKTVDFSETIVVYDLKLATNDRSDKKFLLTSKLCPMGAVCPLPWGYIHVLNHEKNCIKSDFKDNFLKLATNERNDKTFLLTSKLFSLGAVCPCPGAIYMY